LKSKQQNFLVTNQLTTNKFMEEQDNVSLNELAMDSLRVSAKWCTFLSIMGFIFIGLMLLFGLLATVSLSAISSQPEMQGLEGMNPMFGFMKYLPLLYILIAVVYFFPVYYLFKYASGMKKALNFRNSEMVADSLSYLKSHHKFLGVMTIVFISLYIVGIIGIIIFGASMASSMM
jgi:hypothetical protein